MDGILVVLNTCGIRGRDSLTTPHYLNLIRQILSQKSVNYKLVLSSCLNSEECIKMIYSNFGNQLNYNLIFDRLPVNITFNHSVSEMVNKYGRFDTYLLLDSGLDFDNDEFVLEKLYSLHKETNSGLTVPTTDTDFAYHEYMNYYSPLMADKNLKHIEVPIGMSVNSHALLFDNELFKAYDGRVEPDIFAYHCTESVFSFLTSALNKKFIIHNNLNLKHIASLDGESSDFLTKKIDNSKKHWNHMFRNIRDMEKVIQDPEAFECGFGYEEAENVLIHNANAYTENGVCKDPDRLKEFVQKTVFLSKEEFDYSSINHSFI